MKSRRKLDCLVAGDANLDLIVDGVFELISGTEQLARSANLVLGGSSSVTAFNLSSLGLKVGLVSVIGDDSSGELVKSALRSGNVGLHLLRHMKNIGTGITIWHSKAGKRAAVTYPGTIARLKARHIPDEALAQTRHLHVGAYFLLQDFHSGAPALFCKARKAGCTISLDCNYDPTEKWDSGLRRLLPLTDVFFPNEDEARRITGLNNVEHAAQALAKLCHIVAVKRGKHGVLLCHQGKLISFPAHRAKVVDTTGAGDSFNAGFLSKFITGSSLEACAKAGLLAAARCIGKVGGTQAFMSAN